MKADVAESRRPASGRKKDAQASDRAARKVSGRLTRQSKSQDGRSKDGLIREDLSRQLCALITDGTYKPGDRITERELCERLNASRPSIRETLRQLEAEGLLDIYPNRGAVVRKLSTDTVLNLWEVRQALEAVAAERFARHGSPEQVERLEDAIRRMDAALRARDRKNIKLAKSAIFEAFAAGAQNHLLAAYIRQINVRLSFLWSTSLMVAGRPAESIKEMRALLVAIRNRSPEAARAAVILYNEHAKNIAMYALKMLEEQKEA
jgi:GntR family transcriptional regulator, trigonelline degradation regulator